MFDFFSFCIETHCWPVPAYLEILPSNLLEGPKSDAGALAEPAALRTPKAGTVYELLSVSNKMRFF